MQAASPEVARAGASQQPSPVLVSSGGANNSVCSLRVHSSSWPCPRYSEQLAARSHRLCVRPAPQIFKGKPRASCGRAESLQSVRTARGGANPRWWCVSHVGMMVIGPECGGCVCGRCVCDVHAWMRRAVWAMAERVGLREDQSFVGQLRLQSIDQQVLFLFCGFPLPGFNEVPFLSLSFF